MGTFAAIQDSTNDAAGRKQRTAGIAAEMRNLHLRTSETLPIRHEPKEARIVLRLWPSASVFGYRERTKNMLWTICVILLVFWALGMVTAYIASGLIHVLLVIALVVMVVRMQGRSVV